MAVIKPVRTEEVWSSANPTGVIYPGFSKITTGWDLEIPNYQHFNYILAQMSQYIDYINVRGLGDWDLNTTYELGSYVQWSGLKWKSLKISINIEPGTDNTAWIVDDAISLVSTHEARQDNPHIVTKTQVGLGNVEDIDYGTTGKVVNSATADNSILFDSAVKDTSTTLVTATDLKVPTSLAVKTYADTKISLTANQTVSGTKTFSSIPIVPANPITSGDTGAVRGDDVYDYVNPLDNANVKLTGNQTIAGVKTFSSIPVVPSNPVVNGDTGAVRGDNVYDFTYPRSTIDGKCYPSGSGWADGEICLFDDTTGKPIKTSNKIFETTVTNNDARVPTSGAIVDYLDFFVGTIHAFGGTVANLSSKMLSCNGAAVSRTTYSRLFAKIGTIYGSGNGSTTFNVPNLQGIGLRGDGTQNVNGRTKGSGLTVGEIWEDELQTHNHLVRDNENRSITESATLSSGTNARIHFDTTPDPSKDFNATDFWDNGVDDPARGGTETHGTDMIVNWCIFTG